MGTEELQEGLILQLINKTDTILQDTGEIKKNMGELTGKVNMVDEKFDSLEKKVDSHYKEASDRIDNNDKRIGELEKSQAWLKGAWKVVLIVAGATGSLVTMVINWLLQNHQIVSSVADKKP